MRQNRPDECPLCGFVAGIYARTDEGRGVWKALAGIDAGLTGVLAPKTVVTGRENGTLNARAVNCFRSSKVYGNVVWGARTQIRLNVGAFMHGLFRQGAFQGTTPRDAYFVECDRETTTQTDLDNGIVNIVVGFAPLKPAEFVIIKIQQKAGQIAT
jgi:phage tail sheath protein FI